MLNNTREQIFGALFTLLKTAAGFKYFTRRSLSWSQIQSDRRPALVMLEMPESYAQPASDILAEVTLRVNLMIVADVAQYQQSDAEPPISILNGLLDAVEAVLRPTGMSGQQTLGGLIARCWIEGEVFKDSGDIDGTAAAILPLKLLVPA